MAENFSSPLLEASTSGTNGTSGTSGTASIGQASAAVWDPLSKTDWDRTVLSEIASRRIRRDLTMFYQDPAVGIFLVPEENDLQRLHALVVGPENTPYEGGFFNFLMRCPPDFPIRPPLIRLMTTDGGRCRFNPNFYKNGKVCLSILGTWPGPAWSPAQSLTSVLLSIQSLMNENPYHNEPGFEVERSPGDSKRYNEIITHETIRVAVIDHIENPDNSLPKSLHEVMENSFPTYFPIYVAACEQLLQFDGERMIDPFGEQRGIFQPKILLQKLQKLKAKFNA